MAYQFEIQYRAAFGQCLCLVHGSKCEPMSWSGNDVWTVSIEGPRFTLYHYELRENGRILRREYRDHTLGTIPTTARFTSLRDQWNEYSDHTPYLTSVVRSSVGNETRKCNEPLRGGETRIEVDAPFIPSGVSIGITGNMDVLGQWTVARKMEYLGGGRWTMVIPGIRQDTQYKIVTLDAHSRIREWEDGPDRILSPVSDVSARVYREMVPNLKPTWRAAGVAVPVFSLRRSGGYGIGEFRDIVPLACWAAKCGMRIIQLLPINDTLKSLTEADSYPYSSISAFALNPIYVSLEDVLQPDGREMEDILEELRKADLKPTVDFARVAELKMRYLRLAYELSGKSTLESESYGKFRSRNAYWIAPYMAYRTLCDVYSTSDTSRWGKHAVYSPSVAREIISRYPIETGFYGFIQYHLFGQMDEVRKRTRAMGISLKGDLPIGVAPESCDVWMAPECFHMDGSAGAPPDDFSEDGQNWGFPIYDWDRMAQNGYRWWKERLRTMSRLFDAFRIDHILGFFRIWEVERMSGDALRGEFFPSLPYSVKEIRAKGFRFVKSREIDPVRNSRDILFVESRHIHGKYYPAISALRSERFRNLDERQKHAFENLYDDFYFHRNDSLWRACAERRLDAIAGCTDMTVCAEDLGMIPACVPEVLHSKRILTLEIERMPKQFGVEFGATESYPVLSVCTVSTHDTETLRQWLAADHERTRRYMSALYRVRRIAEEDDSPKRCLEVVKRNLDSPSMLCIIPLQDFLSIDTELRAADRDTERINVPADPKHVWNYRMHLSLERLHDESRFNRRLHGIISTSNR